jgi:16S rRNA (cytosine967-C5)-methyltransferase
MSEADVATLVSLQQQLIDAAAPLVRPGGTFIYSVCTLLAAESIEHTMPVGFDVIDEAPMGQWRPFGHGWRVLPHDAGTDGMVIVRYRRAS